MPANSQLEGKVAIVTGGAGQIGRGIAKELAGAGCHIVIADVESLDTEHSQRHPDESSGANRVRGLLDELASNGNRAVFVECDVTDADDVASMIERTMDEFGRLDILVNNAGVITFSAVEEMAEDEWDDIMDVNAKGTFLCSKAAIPALRDTGGTIINNSSVAGTIGSEGLGHYAASKHAVLGLTKVLALELADDDVTVNAICPGVVNTPMWSNVLTPELDESYEEYIDGFIPLGRDQTPEDMGRLALFLATSPNITGEAIKVDGGMTTQLSSSD